MDPNATLASIRELIKQPELTRQLPASGEYLTELITALDEWLSKGGYLPADWQGRS